MANLPRPRLKPHQLPTIPQQLSIAYESTELGGMTPADRAKVLAQLAGLLLQAAGGDQRGIDDGEQ